MKLGDAIEEWASMSESGTKRTFGDVRSLVAIGVRADKGGSAILVEIDPKRTLHHFQLMELGLILSLSRTKIGYRL